MGKWIAIGIADIKIRLENGKLLGKQDSGTNCGYFVQGSSYLQMLGEKDVIVSTLKVGDVVTVKVDFAKQKILFWNNKKFQGLIQSKTPLKEGVLYPSAQMSVHTQLEIINDVIQETSKETIEDNAEVLHIDNDSLLKIEWDKEYCSDMVISNNGATVKHTKKQCNFLLAKTNVGFTNGKHYWEVNIDEASCNAYNIFIGVCLQEAKHTYRLGDAFSFGYRGGDGFVYYNGKKYECGTPFKNRAVIGVLLDIENSTISFYNNGKKQKKSIVLEDVKGKTIFPAVSMINPEESVSISFDRPLPTYSSTIISSS